jgi:DNA-directed RNA polymerase subunit N (RpoN/RPB10)
MHIVEMDPYDSAGMQWKTQAQTIQEIEAKTEINFDDIGIPFYPTKRKVITYINLEPAHELWKQTKNQRKIRFL